MSPAEPIILETGGKGKSKVRILTPSEYDQYFAAIPNKELRTIFETCFWTAARYVEVQRLHKNPDWYLPQRGAIYLPREADRKAKRVAPGRYVSPLPDGIKNILPYFFDGKKPPSGKVWNENLKRWAINSGICFQRVPVADIDRYMENKKKSDICNVERANGHYIFHDLTGIVPKMTRKTLESWMIAVDVGAPTVCNRQGHDELTSLKHYQALPFTEEEKRAIRQKLAGWMLSTHSN